MSDNIITTYRFIYLIYTGDKYVNIMVFGGRKFRNWKEENPKRLGDLYLQSDGDASIMENILNNETKGVCRMQIREFMMKAYEMGYFSKGTKELEDEKKNRGYQQQQAMFRQQQQGNYSNYNNTTYYSHSGT